jgi:hypothetical protein
MNKKITTLAFISLASITLGLASGVVTPAKAQEARSAKSARFDFGRNYWRHEEPRIPTAAPNPHAVRNGSVPMGSSFLGLDKQTLAKPIPQPQMNVQARPVGIQAVPSLAQHQPFNPFFGKPVEKAMPTPVAAQAKPMRFNKAPYRANKSVNAQLVKKPRHVSVPEIPVASYGQGMGYAPGPMVPGSAGGGMRTTTRVQGQILH